MTCPQQSEQLDSYLDGESEPAFTAWFETHQQECQRCAGLVNFHRSFKTMLRESINTERTPDLVRQRLMRALDETGGKVATVSRPAAWHRRPWVKPLMAAASLAMVSTAAWVGLSRSPHPYALAMAVDHSKCCGEVASRQAEPTQFGSVAPPVACADPGQLCRARIGGEPQVAKFDNLHQCDVRVCPIKDSHALHMVYQDPQKNMVSMFGLPENSQFGHGLPDASNGIQPAMFSANNKNLATWKKQGWVYSLVAEMPSDKLSNMAEHGTYTAADMNAAWLAQQPVPEPYPGPNETGYGAGVQPVVWTTR